MTLSFVLGCSSKRFCCDVPSVHLSTIMLLERFKLYQIAINDFAHVDKVVAVGVLFA